MINNQKLSYEIWEKEVPISKNLQNYLKKNNYKKSDFISNGELANFNNSFVNFI